MKKIIKTLTAAVVIMVLITAAGCSGGSEVPEYERIGINEIVQILDENPEAVLLDVRTQEEFASGHIPGALCIPNEVISEETTKELDDKTQTILVYCRSGNRSQDASQKLCKLGYENVIECGGIIDWDGEIEYGEN